MFKWFSLLALLLVAIYIGQSNRQDLPDFNELIETASPAVVKIDSVQKITGAGMSQMNERDIPDIFREPHQGGGAGEAHATGSGFIISSDGYVLTNEHVVENAHEVVIKLIDRREFEAKVIGIDLRSDLALLKIDAQNLPKIEFADSDRVKVGDWALAIGSPFGLDYSVSAGIISAIGRSIPTKNGDNYVPFIQSDVAINPGNSGGPLLNLAGEVVGINSQIFTHSGGSIGLSFAVPSGVAVDVISQLKSKGRVDRGWLGVYVQEVDKSLARSSGLTKTQGALVAQVEAGSPAAVAGMQAGDIILYFDDEEIIESGDLPHVVGLLPPGSQTKAQLIRGKEKKTLDVIVGTLPDGLIP
ncbi:S1C family serine protease [Porticoccus sp.]|uniref:S1C family serine protease n=1 Tax=Porticoccus sp. TaxID=2024853 RepID=UPI003F6A4B05